MQGILCINKPEGFTSFDVVAKMRRISGVRRIGHTGTLDPMATGVLPLLFGRATRLCDLMPRQDKRYTARFALGCTTDTLDSTGQVTARFDRRVSADEVEAALAPFRGEIEQLPPMYSAVQVGGKRLYELARAGQEIERPTRQVTVFSLTLTDFSEETQQGTLDIHCSKGTYVRTICHDLGMALGTGGILTGLVRTAAGGFTLADCMTLEEAEQAANSLPLLPIDAALQEYPALRLNAQQGRMFANGVRLLLSRLSEQPEGICRVYHTDGTFLGLAGPAGEELKIIRLFASQEEG